MPPRKPSLPSPVPALSAVVRTDDWGYTSKELRAGGVSAQELRRGKVFFLIEEWRDAGVPTRELREGGYSASELMACGFKAAELRKHGTSIQELAESR